MGLAIVAEILEENGGVLHVESGAEGTAFEGRIPKTLPERP